MTHRTLFQILVKLMVLNIDFFSRIVNEWNGLPNRIRESNSIATFKKNVLTLLRITRTVIYFYLYIFFLYFN